MNEDYFNEPNPPEFPHWEEEPWECLNCGSHDPNHSSEQCHKVWGDD